MTHATRLTLILLAAAVCLPVAASATSLKDIGDSVTYPVKKGVHNAGKSAKTGAGHASKTLNHAGQAVQYPVRKTGENASKATHQTIKAVKKP